MILSKKPIMTERLELRFEDNAPKAEFTRDIYGELYDYRAIYLKNSNLYIGEIYITEKSNELSIFLEKNYQRSGICTEASFAYIKEIFGNTRINEVKSVVLKSNIASIAFHKKFEIPGVEMDDERINFLTTKDHFLKKFTEFTEKNFTVKNIESDGFEKKIDEVFK